MARSKPYSRVYLEITNICNLSCSFCHGTKRPHRMMGEAELAGVLEKLTGLTDYIYFHLMGEPTAHPQIARFIALARERGFKPMITTNGTLLDRVGDEIIAAGLYKVNISLHSFEKDSPNEAISYINSCAEFAKRAAKSGTIVTLRLWNGGAGIDNSHTLNTLRAAFPSEWVENNRGAKLSERIFIEYADRFGWPDIDSPELGSEVYCHALSDHFGILTDGTVVPCCLDGDGVISLGNAFSDDLSKILSSERAEAMLRGFRARRVEEPLCKRCPYARRF